jgi:hypothetical protein
VTVNVGVDFDEPIYPWYDLAHKASVKAGIAQPHHEPTVWTPYEVYGCTAEEWYAVIDNEILNGDMYHQPLDPERVALLNGLYDEGLGIHIVTARGNFGPLGETIKQITLDSIEQAGLKTTSVHFVPQKVETALALGLDYMVDDHQKYHDPMIEAGVNSFLLDAPWNQDHPEKYYPVGHRVKSLAHYVGIIRHEQGL